VKIGEVQQDCHLFITNEYLKGENFIPRTEHSEPPRITTELGRIIKTCWKKYLAQISCKNIRDV